MAVTFSNQWTQSWANLEYRGTVVDGCHQFRIQAKWRFLWWGRTLQKIQNWRDDKLNSIPILVSSLFQLTKRVSKQKNMATALSANRIFSSAWFLHINGYDHYTPEEEKRGTGLQEEILTAYGLTSNKRKWKNQGLHAEAWVCDNGNFYFDRKAQPCASIPYQPLQQFLLVWCWDFCDRVALFIAQYHLGDCFLKLWIQPLKMWWI